MHQVSPAHTSGRGKVGSLGLMVSTRHADTTRSAGVLSATKCVRVLTPVQRQFTYN